MQADSWRIVSSSDDKTLKVWELETGQRLVTLRCEIFFSRENDSTSRNENYIHSSFYFFRSHTDGVTCLQFNDFYIVSGSYDKTVKLWDFTVCWYIVIFSWKWFHGNFFYTYTNYSNRSWYNNDNIVLYTLNLGCSWLLFRIPTLHNQHFWNFFRVYLLLIWVFGDQNANLKMKWSRFLCSRKFKQRPRSKWKNKIKEVFCHLEININIVLDPAYNLSRLLARIAQTKKNDQRYLPLEYFRKMFM